MAELGELVGQLGCFPAQNALLHVQLRCLALPGLLLCRNGARLNLRSAFLLQLYNDFQLDRLAGGRGSRRDDREGLADWRSDCRATVAGRCGAGCGANIAGCARRLAAAGFVRKRKAEGRRQQAEGGEQYAKGDSHDARTRTSQKANRKSQKAKVKCRRRRNLKPAKRALSCRSRLALRGLHDRARFAGWHVRATPRGFRLLPTAYCFPTLPEPCRSRRPTPFSFRKDTKVDHVPGGGSMVADHGVFAAFFARADAVQKFQQVQHH